ncbi:MAG: glutathione S-transferase family protein, partial [Rhodospirillaceae bacterium]|nr:glutathione S-transferase family protein [Rhodospirillaceae bacterium]
MADIKLYGFNMSTYVRTARIGLIEKDIAYDSMPLEMWSEEHLALNPFGKIPVMKHGETVIIESLAIAAYLDAHFGGPRLIPEGAAGVRTMQWIGSFNDSVQSQLNMGVVFERVAKPMFGMETNEETIAENMPKVERMMPVLDAAVANGGHFGGNEPTQADWYFVPSINYAAMCPDTQDLVAAQPNLSDWL